MALALQNIEFSGKKYQKGALFLSQYNQSPENIELLYIREISRNDITECLEFLNLLEIGNTTSQYPDTQKDEYTLLPKLIQKNSTPESVIDAIREKVLTK